MRENNQGSEIDIEEKKKKNRRFKYLVTIILVFILAILIAAIIIINIVMSNSPSEPNPGLVILFSILMIVTLMTLMVIGQITSDLFGKEKIKNTTDRRVWRKRRKLIRDAGLDQLEDGQEALSPEELEERINARLANRQRTERRRPVIEILNETPSNELILEKMVFKGVVKGKTCAICKLDIRKRQKITQCPHCQSLFHFNHLKDWFKNNNDCPVCDEILVRND